MKDFIRNRMRYILRKHFLMNIALPDFNWELPQLRLSELEKLELVWYLEIEFGIDFSHEEVACATTLAKLADRAFQHYVHLHHLD
jgi:hypothetical protein